MTILESFGIAVEHHQGGRLAEAESIYHQILAAEPLHADALQLLGVIAHQTGQHDRAVDLIRQAIALAPNAPKFHGNLGVALVEQADAHNEAGRREAALAAFAEALPCFRRIVSDTPQNAAGYEWLGRALLGAGERDEGLACLWRALELQPDLPSAHLTLAHALLPGDGYGDWLRRFQEWLRPAVYLEIGVETGASLALARPPTHAIGIDPAPKISQTFTARTEIFAMPSDDFFATNRLPDVTGRKHIDLAFIDGLHSYDQVLRDFVNVEVNSHPATVVLVHDCLPLDDLTSARERRTTFWTGDTWKIIPLLKSARPDLTIFTIATPPSGLAVVTGLDATSSVLSERFDEFVSAQKNVMLSSIDDRPAAFGVVANDPETVRATMGAAFGQRA